MIERTIPRTGEALPAVGMGTWRTFDAGPEPATRARLSEVLRRFFAAGARLIDSSPMYGRSESVIGDLLAGLRPAAHPFLATKVWTTGRDEGVEQMRTSMRRMRAERMDLMQIHNLVDWRTHLETLRAWKQDGIVRYVGVTHYQLRALPLIEQIVRDEDVDFIQVPYSPGVREAAERLLPLARDRGVAVLVMRPLQQGDLVHAARSKPLPPWASELGCTTWSQLFLKFALAHPAVTCAIPATGNPEHMAENLLAGEGPLPDEATQRRIIESVGG